MIVARYITREIALTFAGVVGILLLIAMSVQMVGLFNKVASGELAADVVLITMALKSVNIIVVILPLAFFLGILLAFSRLYQDSEMTALLAAGVGPFYVLRSVVGLAILVAALQAVLSLQLAPWAEEYAQRLGEEAADEAGIKGLSAGRFREMDTGQGVVYAENLDASSSSVTNLFVQRKQGKTQTLVKADRAYEFIDDKGNRYIILENGYRYEGEPGQEGYVITSFEKHGLLIEKKDRGETNLYRKSIPTSALLNSDKSSDIAELQWRVSSALLCLTLAILAVPLSRTTPRQGRYGRLIIAIILYMVFSNLLTMARSWLYKGEIPASLGLWWIHGLILCVAMFFFAQQFGWRYLLGINKA